MHHGGQFTGNPRKYVGGAVDVVDNCDPERWSKVEIEGMRRDFRYTSVSKLWYKILEWTKKWQIFIWLLMIMMPCT